MAEGAGGIFGLGGAAAQLFEWQVLGQAISAALQPQFELLTREVNKILPATPLSPAQLADMVVRNILEHTAAESYARESGIAPADFTRMVQSAGEPPSPQELIAALRRGVIEHDGTGPDSTSFQQGIAESRFYNKWRPVLEALGNVPLGVADAVDGVVENQITRAQGEHYAYLAGVSQEDFGHLVDIRGNPPSPTELNELHRRGLIPLEGTGPQALSVQQGISEGATKDKWWKLLAALADYIPPPRTVTALVREGTLTDAQALVLFQQAGLSQELAAAYLHSAHSQKTAAAKELARGDIESLYQQGVLSRADAGGMLQALGYSTEDVDLLLTLVDIRREVQAVNGAISRVHGYYVARRIELAEASNDLDALRIPAAQRDQLLATWEIERASNLKTLTAAEITGAYQYNLIDQDTATALLVADGYDAAAAWILLSVRKHAPQPNVPAGIAVPKRG